ncbi:hypothetical protein VE04_08034, partial [Pseudogymnoascus sp. 24MN13]
MATTYSGPSAHEMIQSHTLAKEIVARSNDPAPVLDPSELALLKRFVTNSPSKNEILKDLDTTDPARGQPVPNPRTRAAWSATLLPSDTAEDIAICLAVKDQYADLTEWLTHHYHHLSIRRFYIMDNGPSPALATYNYSAFLDPKAITHRYYHPSLHHRYQQLVNYSHCMKLFGDKHKWIAFIDADEYLEYDDDDSVGAFAANWQIHTSDRPRAQGRDASKTKTPTIPPMWTRRTSTHKSDRQAVPRRYPECAYIRLTKRGEDGGGGWGYGGSHGVAGVDRGNGMGDPK